MIHAKAITTIFSNASISDVHPIRAPQGQTTPYTVWHLIGETNFNSLAGTRGNRSASNLVDVYYQLNHIGSTVQEAADRAYNVRVALEGDLSNVVGQYASGTNLTYTSIGIEWQNEQSDYDEESDLFLVIHDIKIMYKIDDNS